MKRNIHLGALIIFVLSMRSAAFSQGYILPNGVTYAGGALGSGYGINVVHNPTNFESTGFVLIPRGKTPANTQFTNTFRFDSILDVSVRVFLVSLSTPITTNTLLSGGLTELQYSPTSGYVFANGVPFYLALYTGNQNFYPPNGIYSDPLFGWVQLVNNQGVIQLLDSALAYGAGGIYAGTQTLIAVPEPSVFGLLGLGAMMLLNLRAKKFVAPRRKDPAFSE